MFPAVRGTLTGLKGALNADSTCMQSLEPLVTSLSFDSVTVAPGGVYSATFSGVNLSGQTYFDVRFLTPGSSAEQEALNWQVGTTAPHTVPSTLASGDYSVIAVRAHKEIADHSVSYVPVSASITVR